MGNSEKKHIDELERLNQTIQELEGHLSRERASGENFIPESSYKYIFENINIPMALINRESLILRVNSELSRLSGYSREEIEGKMKWMDFIADAADLERMLEYNRLRKTSTGNAPGTCEIHFLKKSGTSIEVTASVIIDQATGILFVGFNDVNESGKKERALVKSEKAFRAIFENAHDAIFLHTIDGQIIDVNRRMLEMFAVTRERVLKTPQIKYFSSRYNPLDRLPEWWARAVNGEPVYFEWMARQPDGGMEFFVEVSLKKINLGDEDVILANVRDISENKKAEDIMKESEEKYRALVENSNDTIARLDRDLRYSYVNQSVKKMTGIPSGAFIGKRPRDMGFPEGLYRMWDDVIREVFSTGEVRRVEFQLPNSIWVDWMVIPERNSEGEIESVVTSAHDITDLKESQALMQIIFDSVPVVLLVTDTNRKITKANNYNLVTFGYRPEEITGKSMDIFFFSKNDFIQTSEKLETQNTLQEEVRMKHKDGHEVWTILSRSPLKENDETAGSITVALDITNIRILEEQLRQSQKMEAVGQLAGGVAHDFNNMLQAITGYAEMVMASLDKDDKNHARIGEILKAGNRAAKLTQQLLAFSRRQVLQLQAVDLNEVIDELLKMLGRLIGENIDLAFFPDSSLNAINADRVQLEQVIINLCVNARDAMPDGGSLTIRTKNVSFDEEYCVHNDWASPGSYARVSITDSGHGIDSAIMDKIFEPFFTTKEKHRGTGLGLATVYGIVRQHNGMIHVYSEKNRGSTFNIYFPATGIKTEPVYENPGEASGGSETILIAEDDERIRSLSWEILTQAGYDVLVSSNGEEALEIYNLNRSRIDILLLDVMMPKMNGRMVYDIIREADPSIKCIFISGYSEDAVHTNFILDYGLVLLQKPFGNRELLQTVRRELDRKP